MDTFTITFQCSRLGFEEKSLDGTDQKDTLWTTDDQKEQLEILDFSGWVTERVTVSVAVNAAWQLKNWHKTSDWYPLVI